MPLFPTYPILSPAPAAVHRCTQCLGPVGRTFARCLGCSRAWRELPATVKAPVLPVTVALEGADPWYHALKAYKRTEGARGWDLRHVLSAFLHEQSSMLSAWMGHASPLVTVVPSKRDPTHLPTAQPLFRVVTRSVEDADLGWPVEPTMRYAGHPITRQQPRPDAFDQLPTIGVTIRGASVLLVDDAWVSGATMLSVAWSLVAAGASRVHLLVLSRVIRASFWETADPAALAEYQGAQRAFQPSEWPLG